MKSGCAGGGRFAPRPGQYSKESFSSNQETGKVFSPEMPLWGWIEPIFGACPAEIINHIHVYFRKSPTIVFFKSHKISYGNIQLI